MKSPLTGNKLQDRIDQAYWDLEIALDGEIHRQFPLRGEVEFVFPKGTRNELLHRITDAAMEAGWSSNLIREDYLVPDPLPEREATFHLTLKPRVGREMPEPVPVAKVSTDTPEPPTQKEFLDTMRLLAIDVALQLVPYEAAPELAQMAGRDTETGYANGIAAVFQPEGWAWWSNRDREWHTVRRGRTFSSPELRGMVQALYETHLESWCS